MATIRTIEQIITAQPVMEGAGVKLNRVFAHLPNNVLDPFLLLDHFGSKNPADYLAGFPWHPHRGIETVTYMLSGQVEHQDSLGNKGVIGPGDIQWMTAGSGIIHQEMPKQDPISIEGFQLWVNIPASHKMMAPRYQGFAADSIPTLNHEQATIKVICGSIDNQVGPITDLMITPNYLDIHLPANQQFNWAIPNGHTVFAYIFQGQGLFTPTSSEMINHHQLVRFSDGDEIQIQSKDQDCRFLLISGKPLNEPIAWGGPIVMNTREELNQAFEDYNNGTFIQLPHA